MMNKNHGCLLVRFFNISESGCLCIYWLKRKYEGRVFYEVLQVSNWILL